ncbi:hypothetical protein F8388_005680 [Cannabis sativa]|uniref:Beta-hexosaminidase n=1 Tax=Cannabis sativa TaxID=3483 RepID=A0A7J6H6G5_CANSA|nr:hypothetical protein F8388_005680 [Cannabis sativa]KAF4394633.1 hypothetical protein G4B88_009883 [Cannabis sativa]
MPHYYFLSEIIKAFIFLIFFFIGAISSPYKPKPTSIDVWPKPRTVSWSQPQAHLLSPTFSIATPSHRYLRAAANRYRAQILTEHHQQLVPPSVVLINVSATPLQALNIDVADLTAPLHHGVDESYNLSIPASGSVARLTARTAWGAMRGLESFSQLVWGSPSVVAVGISLSDSPLFGHRGLMLDTSRNYFPVKDIVRTISAMSANKLNVFHWHITDSHSFPLMVPSEPDLADKGSYGSDMQYSPDDVTRIVEFGLQHGVRVMPEIDAPAHTGSWAQAYPDIVTCANMFWWPAGAPWEDRLAAEPGTGQLNPLNPKTYKVVKNIINDIIKLFPEPYYHGGADEIIPNCWKLDPTIQSMLSNGGTLSQVLEIFVNSTLPYITSLNRTVVYWEDILLDETIKVDPKFLPPENIILQTWRNGHNNTKQIVSAGYRTIVSSSEFYYLDCGHGDFTGNNSIYNIQTGTTGDGGSWCNPFKTWQTIYNYDILYGLSKEESKLVLGGEVALWSEQADQTVLDSRIWPRASALAEVLWSGNRDEKTGIKRSAEATDRLNEWRSRMVSRGVGAEPIQPLWCVRNPGMCNTAN